ncbi:MAG: hypothetical protein WAM28_05940 [Chlamydiales bacterium]
MATPDTPKIYLNFGWEGPNRWNGGWSHGGSDISVVNLVFKNAKDDISVHIPDNISPSTVQKLPFTYRRYRDRREFKVLSQETHPSRLSVTIEQIHNLTLKAGIFTESPHRGLAIMGSSGAASHQKRILRSDREIRLELPEELEIGETYTLVVTSNDYSLSARLQKEEKQIHPQIKVPDSRPSESSCDLDLLSAEELQSRFAIASKKDIEFENQRLQAAKAGNLEEINRIVNAELKNSQLLINLSEALKRKGIETQFPQPNLDQSLATLNETCKTQ